MMLILGSAPDALHFYLNAGILQLELYLVLTYG